MLFCINLSSKELKKIKKADNAVSYKLISKLSSWHSLSFNQLLSIGRENGIEIIDDKQVYKKLSIIEDTIYKFRLSQSIRCYCIQSTEHDIPVLEIIHIDTQHKTQK